MTQTMLKAAAALAEEVGAKAIVSFIEPVEFSCDIPPVIWVRDLQLDVLRDLTMHDILEISERHLHDAAVQIYISQKYEFGKVVGVFPYAILVYDIDKGKEFISVQEFDDLVPRGGVMTAVLQLALEIAVEGREGHSIGTAFIIGNTEEIFSHSHSAIINPYQGHRKEVRDITNRGNWESVKEFAQLDGVFVVDTTGTIQSAGRYIDVKGEDLSLPHGMGGRHRATASLTRIICGGRHHIRERRHGPGIPERRVLAYRPV
ncbi:diadenylate cyclase [Methanogenium cariaci]|uniref:DNA integrity scanning protein DisA nucleotide-binding domain protein n=1 Tax=Methanogenium cariaci TaxID=2197 RepID=UPI000AA47E5B|nr:diadenylate cyclase [Methanogenium cariaci]